jgi:hypothetical protein
LNHKSWTRSTRLSLALVAGLAVVFWLIVGVALPASTRLTNGFAAYYTAARLVREGQSVARFYDDAWFRDQTIRLGFDRGQDIFYVNPPVAAGILLPLATLKPVDAKQVWTAFNLLCLTLAILGLSVTVPSYRRLRGLALALLLVGLFEPVAEEIRLGQAYALLLLTEVAFCAAYLHHREALAGLSLGGMIGLKTVGLGLPVVLALNRRWVALASVAGVVALIVLSGAAVLGLSAWSAYLIALVGAATRDEIAVTAYQSVPGLVAHLFRFDPTWNRQPLVDLPQLVAPLAGGIAVILAGLTAWRSARAPTNQSARLAALAAWAVVSVVLSPLSADYHYTLTVLPAFLLLEPRLSGSDRRLSLALVLVATVLIGAPWPGRLFATGDGIAALIAYPRLYGGLLLWGVATFDQSKENGADLEVSHSSSPPRPPRPVRPIRSTF